MRGALLALPVLVLLMPGQSTHAGPPDASSGAMVLDEVADGLLRYRKEREVGARVKLLQRLAPTRDPRVAIALAQVAVDPELPLGERGRQHAAFFLMEHYIPRDQWVYDAKYSVTAARWWEANEADLRRQARQQP